MQLGFKSSVLSKHKDEQFNRAGSQVNFQAAEQEEDENDRTIVVEIKSGINQVRVAVTQQTD